MRDESATAEVISMRIRILGVYAGVPAADAFIEMLDEVVPVLVSLHLNLARLLVRHGQVEAARNHVRMAVGLDPKLREKMPDGEELKVLG